MARGVRPWPGRFWAKVQKGPGCWLWTGALDGKGYGTIAVTRGKGVYGAKYAHRVAWELTFGPIPPGLCCCHRCDNPPCVNPAHIFLGTKAENTADAVSKGRHARGETHASTLSKDDVIAVRRLREVGASLNYIAREFGVTKSCIAAIAAGRTWRSLEVSV